MLRLSKPNAETISRFLDEQARSGPNLPMRRRDSERSSSRFRAGSHPGQTWRGRNCLRRCTIGIAKLAAVSTWMDDAWPANAPLRKGQVVALLAQSIGLWWLNPCRIVYLIDEDLREKKFGFAYGTLPDHACSGEERFLVEMDDEETVWYDILAFSRPNRVLARIGYPFVRRVQERFAQDSAEVMQKFVRSAL